MPKDIKPVKAWAGITDNQIKSGWKDLDGKLTSIMDIFATKYEAQRKFEYVIPVLIFSINPKRKKK